MAMKNHGTMLKIGKLLDENAQICAKDQMSESDFVRMHQIDGELRCLGQSIGCTMPRKRQRKSSSAFRTSVMVTSEEDVVSALRAGRSMNYIMRYMRVGYQRISRIIDEYDIERKEG